MRASRFAVAAVVAMAAVAAPAGIVAGQPADPWGSGGAPADPDPAPVDPPDPGSGADDPGSAAPDDPGTADPGTVDPGTVDPGTVDPGTVDPGAGSAGAGSAVDPGAGSAVDPGGGSADPGAGSADPGGGSADPGGGSADPGGGSADPGAGSADPGGGSADPGAGSAGSGSAGPRVIPLPTDANAPQVSAAAAPTVVRLGTRFTLFVTATFAPGVEVNLRDSLDLGPAFEITRQLSEDRPAGGGRTTREWQLEVIAWELGDLVIRPIAVTYTAFGKAARVATNAVRLRVEGVLGDVVDDPKAMRDHAEPTDLLVRDWFWLYVGIGAVIGLGVLVTAIAMIRRRRRRVALVGASLTSIPRKFDTPASRALEKLLAIESSGVLERDDDRKQGFQQMVEVIREYLGSRYRVATYDLTTSELMRQLERVAPEDERRSNASSTAVGRAALPEGVRRSNASSTAVGRAALPEGVRRSIERWLESCDIVKYGGLKASAADGKRTLDAARDLVLSTSQPARPAAPPPASPERPPASPERPPASPEPGPAEPRAEDAS